MNDAKNHNKIKYVESSGAWGSVHYASGWLWVIRLCKTYCRNSYIHLAPKRQRQHTKLQVIGICDFLFLLAISSIRRWELSTRSLLLMHISIKKIPFQSVPLDTLNPMEIGHCLIFPNRWISISVCEEQRVSGRVRQSQGLNYSSVYKISTLSICSSQFKR